jgi:aspartate/methionine/tyrosine aminotransferase
MTQHSPDASTGNAANRRPQSAAARIARAGESATLAVGALAAKLRKAGKTIIDFSVGEPDFVTPDPIREAGVAAIRAGHTHYTLNAGIPALREAICAKLARENTIAVEPDQVLVSTGAKQSIYNAVMATIDPGDEVLFFAPGWVSYRSIAQLADGNVVAIPTQPEEGFLPDPAALEEAITPRSRMVILNSPSNPTGAVWPAERLKAIGEICLKHQLIVLSDEIYEHLVYDGNTHTSIFQLVPELLENGIVVNGLSKAFAMTGWRIGYAAGARWIIKAAASIQSHATSCANAIAQHAGVTALNDPKTAESIASMKKTFVARRDAMFARLSAIPELTLTKPGGAFYCFPEVSALIAKAGASDDIDLAKRLIEDAGVAIVPGAGFDAPGAIRFSYALGEAAMADGLSRFEAFVKGL